MLPAIFDFVPNHPQQEPWPDMANHSVLVQQLPALLFVINEHACFGFAGLKHGIARSGQQIGSQLHIDGIVLDYEHFHDWSLLFSGGSPSLPASSALAVTLPLSPENNLPYQGC